MTDPPRRPWFRRASALSVRARITVSTVTLAALALASVGFFVYTLESASIESDVRSRVAQELAEFRQLAESDVRPTDVETGEPVRTAAGLIRVFLTRNVPDDDELLIGYAGDRQEVVSPTRYRTVRNDPLFRATVEPLLASGGSTRLDHPDFGEIVLTVQPLEVGDTSGALVIAHFLADERSELVGFIRTFAILALLLVGVTAGLAAWQAGRLLAPVRTLQETAQHISATDLSRRIPESGNDDISALTRTFNEMLGRLDRAFRAQREFLDDAGHELKTPLTIMSGHLELLDPHDADDVSTTRALLLDETDRMARLVRELILLAKLDRPDFLTVSAVELGALTDRLLDKCRVLGDRRWVLDDTADVRAHLDEQRMTQAMVQLAQNATKHTVAGDEIGIGSQVAPDGLRLWVRDTGRGVRDEDKSVIFERFGRGRVAPGDEGFGLGLSIVHGIVTAHGGTITVRDHEPQGACFEITLPLSPSPTRKDDPWPAS